MSTLKGRETKHRNTLVVLCKRVATNIDLVIEHLLMGGQNPAIWQTAMVSVKLQPFKSMKTLQMDANGPYQTFQSEIIRTS